MPSPFQLFGAHPALDFVNTLDNRFVAGGPIELLGSYADLLAFVRQSDLLNARRVAALARQGRLSGEAKAVHEARELREALADFIYGSLGPARKPPPPSTKTLERYFLDADRHRGLMWQRPPGNREATARARWDWGRFETSVELPLWVIAQSAAGLLTSDAMDHVHMCGSETCRWLFLDLSKNHSRRWCNMQVCGNRMKARRYHARAK